MQVRVLATADIHFSNNNSNFPSSGGVSDLLKSQSKAMKYFIEVAEEREVDMVVVPGDVMDKPVMSPIELKYLNEFISDLVELSLSEVDVIVLGGNHSLDDKHGEFTPLGSLRPLLKDLENFHLVTNRNRWVHTNYCSVYNSLYERDFDAIKRRIVEAEPIGREINLLLGHWPSANALLDNGVKSPKGVCVFEEDLENFDLAIYGDFHKHQLLHGTSKAFMLALLLT